MRLEDIHVGDVLRIREWDDMVAEYRKDPDGDISLISYSDFCYPYFVRTMRYLCGKVFTVKSINIDNTLYSVEGIELATDPYNTVGFDWNITAEMLEPVCEDDFEPVDLLRFLM